MALSIFVNVDFNNKTKPLIKRDQSKAVGIQGNSLMNTSSMPMFSSIFLFFSNEGINDLNLTGPLP